MSHPAKKPSRSKFSLSLAALFFSLPHQSSPAPSITLIFRSRVDLLFQRVDEEMRVVLFLIVSLFASVVSRACSSLAPSRARSRTLPLALREKHWLPSSPSRSDRPPRRGQRRSRLAPLLRRPSPLLPAPLRSPSASSSSRSTPAPSSRPARPSSAPRPRRARPWLGPCRCRRGECSFSCLFFGRPRKCSQRRNHDDD